jgi:nucleoside 2-deoxyribosyltransferase
MRGIPDFNFPLFRASAKQLRDLGIEVHSPHENEAAEAEWAAKQDTSYNPKTGAAGDQYATLRHFMKVDLPLVLDSDAVVLLPDWERSQGTHVETTVAALCGVPMYEYGNFVRHMLRDERLVPVEVYTY